ncbi:MAG: fibronectin type III domain-containing protein [Sandaracinaceae bacterium]|nr:fibronectin type III domain-containing protein [Sandaracinaceae bacterium]
MTLIFASSSRRLAVGLISLSLTLAGCAMQLGDGEDAVGRSNAAVVPGAATALTAQPLSTRALLAWTAPVVVPAITDYVIEYKLSAASTWSTFAHAPSALATATVTGLTNGSSYDFRVSAINTDGTGPVSAQASCTPNMALDQLTPTVPAVAYGLRKLRTAYAGSAVRVRRATGGTSDIGFASNGDLDSATLTTFCAATNCFITDWYDQSGNFRDFSQATTTKQARIVNAGVIDLAGGQPAAVFSGGQYYGSTYNATNLTSGAGTITTVNFVETAATVNQALFSNADGSTNRYCVFAPWGDGRSYLDFGNIGGAMMGRIDGPLTWTGMSVGTYRRSGAQGNIFKNGTSAVSGAAMSTASTSVAPMWLGVYDGAGAGSFIMNGTVSELMAFTTALSTVERGLLERNQGKTFGVTIPASLPLAPTAPVATSSTPGQASVAFTPPASDGGASITTYTVTSSPGGLTGTGTTSPIVVSGLTNGTTYTFTVTATNSAGTGPASAASVGVLVGCTTDANCTAGNYCDTPGTNTCLAKVATGVVIPGGASCSAGASTRCLSGVCDADNICGHANAAGPCTTMNAAGASGTCRSQVCDPAAASGAGLCRACTASDLTNCGGATPLCDSTTFACVACNGDNGTAVSAACGSVAPYCPGSGGACTTCGTAGGTVTCMVVGATHAGLICQASGACANSCVNDSNCMGTSWCDTGAGPAACTADLANGVAIPNVPSHASPPLTGACTVAAASAVCASLVCDSDHACGYANGTGPCTTGTAGVVCRSGACSADGTCRPSGGCNVNADCASTEWCESATTHMCMAKAATGAAIPGAGTCAGSLSSRCLSGVCDADNICGHANGAGSCTTGDAAGTAGTCRSQVCDGAAAGGTGLCRECTAANLDNCAGATPLCDSGTFTCSACNGDNGAGTSATCTVVAPYCPGGGASCTTCGTAGESAACTAAGATHAGGICQTTGACADSCLSDSNCAMTQWCDTGAGPAACAADVANGLAIPNVPSHTSPTLDGTCTEAAAMTVCESGVCDSDNLCGYADETGPCTAMTSTTVCRSGACSTTGTCRAADGCNANEDCTATEWCDTTAHSCIDKADTGDAIPGGGTCALGLSVRCLSGVCDGDNVCGHANAAGPCTLALASGASGQCRSGVCDAAAGGGTGLCRECTSIDASNCSGAAAICDSVTFACVACNGDDGTTASAACDASAPYCPGAGGACATCGTAGATVACMDGAAEHAGGTCQSSGACADACLTDSNCSDVQWCNTDAGPAVCAADLANGVGIPNVPSHADPVLDGTCTPEAATLVCQSGVCDTADDACGYANDSGPCTSDNAALVCRSGACSSTGTCRPATGCNADPDCAVTEYCDTDAHSCESKANTGIAIPGGGSCSAGESSRCLSGVCGTDNICGHPNAQGPCSLSDAAGPSGSCRSNVCDPTAAGGTGLCRQCTASDSTNCSGGGASCDLATFTCAGACTGDFGTSASVPCGESLPYCPGAGAACTTCGTAGTTATCSDAAATHAGPVCLASGACGDGPLLDGGVSLDAGVPSDGSVAIDGSRPDGAVVDGAVVEPVPEPESGCGCDVPGQSTRAPLGFSIALLVLFGGALARRRTRG